MLLSFPNMISHCELCKSFGKKFIFILENDTQPLVENDYIMDGAKKFVQLFAVRPSYTSIIEFKVLLNKHPFVDVLGGGVTIFEDINLYN